MRRHRRFLEFLCPPLIIIGISLAPGCSRKSEPNKFILLAEGLVFFPRILVYLHVDVHPDMESRPKQSASPDRSIRSDASAPRQESKRRKHSRARSVSILLRYRPGGVLLAIKDNGDGPSPTSERMSIRHV